MVAGSSKPEVGVLAVQGDVREHLAALRAVGAAVRTVRRPGELAGLDGLVIPGGESTVMDKLVRAFGLYVPLTGAIHAGLPVFGSCAGMILLADRVLDGRCDQQTLGGLDITVRRNAFGRQVDSFETDLRVAVLGDGPLLAVFIRAPWVEELGPGVELLASVERAGVEHPVAVRAGGLLATSFHPEVTGDLRMHAYFVDEVVAGARRIGSRLPGPDTTKAGSR